MTKKIRLQLEINGKNIEGNFALGDPKPGNHPLQYQLQILETQYGATLPKDAHQALAKLQEIAEKKRSSAEALYYFIIKNLAQAEILLETFSENKVFEIGGLESEKVRVESDKK